jgi:hypothetical protein
MALDEQELQALHYIAAGQDPFAGCCASGDFGRRLRILAALRRAGMIDHGNQLTAPARGLLFGDGYDDLAAG